MLPPVGFERFRPWYAALRQGGAADPISILGAKLAAWLTSRGSTLYDLASGGVPATVSGPVGLREDQSGNGRDATQATAPARPTWTGTAISYDGVDDALNITLPAISGGQIVIASPVGIWIDSLDFAGGTFSLGPTTYAGGPAGLWSLLGNAEMQVCILDDAMTSEEQDKLVAYLVAQGSPGLITRVPAPVVNGGFDTSLSGWAIGNIGSSTTGWAWVSGSAKMDSSAAVKNRSLFQSALTSGKIYIVEADVVAAPEISISVRVNFAERVTFMSSGKARFIATADTTTLLVFGPNNCTSSVDNIVVDEVILP